MGRKIACTPAASVISCSFTGADYTLWFLVDQDVRFRHTFVIPGMPLIARLSIGTLPARPKTGIPTRWGLRTFFRPQDVQAVHVELYIHIHTTSSPNTLIVDPGNQKPKITGTRMHGIVTFGEYWQCIRAAGTRITNHILAARLGVAPGTISGGPQEQTKIRELLHQDIDIRFGTFRLINQHPTEQTPKTDCRRYPQFAALSFRYP